jgi:hypothetical protein
MDIERDAASRSNPLRCGCSIRIPTANDICLSHRHARHVDFNYEVSRALAACEGAVLVVGCDAGDRGAELANVYLAVTRP